MTATDLSNLPPILCTLYVESEVHEDLTDELHLFSANPTVAAFLDCIDSEEPLSGQEYALHSYWTLDTEGLPQLCREVGTFDLSAAKWNGEFLCASVPKGAGTLEEMSNYFPE